MNSKKIITALIAVFSMITVNAQNPIFPLGMYIADPSAHVWSDGKMYVYGSRDESPDYYCSWSHHVFASDDLIHWTVTENAFASKGVGDQVPYNDAFLFAPDCQYKNGMYYLYYCMSDPILAEGVATSTSPTGPFTNAKPIKLRGFNEIDPCVFMDDDGQAYYIWGQFSAKVAKLKPNMTEIDTNTIVNGVVTEKEHFFHEGGYMVKRNGIYYFVYAHMGRAGRPTCIGYSTSKSPFGPFKYGGVIVDNDHCDPSVWNNHGSIVEFKGKWYVFYHRATHNTFSMRKTCVEPITFNEDGSINEVEMTTQGAGAPLKATSQIDAERACLLYGNVRIQGFGENNEILAGIRNADFAAYKYIDFGDGVETITIRVAPGKNQGKIEVVANHSWDYSVGYIDVPGNGDGKTWITLTGKVKGLKGVKALWFKFVGQGDDLFKVDWFNFSK